MANVETDSPNRVLYRIQFGLRIALFLVLLGGAVLVSAEILPSSRTHGQFRSALTAGEVDRVTWRGDASGVFLVHWSESPLVWHEVVGSELWRAGEAYTPDLLSADVGRAPNRPSVEHVTDHGGSIVPDWPFRLPGGGFPWWLAAAWVVALVVMVGSRPRLGNRWAWFWLFTVGEIGALLFLVLEPRPLWRGPGPGAEHSRPIGGGTGCGYSIVLAVVSVLLALGLGWVIRTLLE